MNYPGSKNGSGVYQQRRNPMTLITDQIILSAAAKTLGLSENEERFLFITIPVLSGHADSVDMEVFIATVWAADSVRTQDLPAVQAGFYQWLDARR